MQCAIYRGSKKYDSYLFVEKEDDFSRVPQPLLDMLGRLELAMTLELTPERKLARADVNEVMQKLTNDGYFLQMPDESEKLPLARKLPSSHNTPTME